MNNNQHSFEGKNIVTGYDKKIIIDGAHNKEGVEAFFHSAKKYNNIKIIFIS